MDMNLDGAQKIVVMVMEAMVGILDLRGTVPLNNNKHNYH